MARKTVAEKVKDLRDEIDVDKAIIDVRIIYFKQHLEALRKICPHSEVLEFDGTCETYYTLPPVRRICKACGLEDVREGYWKRINEKKNRAIARVSLKKFEKVRDRYRISC